MYIYLFTLSPLHNIWPKGFNSRTWSLYTVLAVSLTETSSPVIAEREPRSALAAEGAGRVVAAAVPADALLRALVHVHAGAAVRRRAVTGFAHALE